VFLLANFDREPAKDGLFHAHFSGTGFFIGSDGTALTASHVVYATAHHPDKYRLLAIVGREFYDATIVCSSKLPYDPLNGDRNQVGVQLSRDVAEVKLAPSTAFEGRQDELYFFPKDAPRFPLARAHTDALPVFPYLTISGEPAAYGRVRVIGFGHISPIPQRWASEGRVDRAWSAGDGTPLFDLESANPAQPGDSGSPVLNDQNQVVGIYAWHSYHEPTRGTMEGNAVFQKPCP
jgi:V8-like Glu-specific endopeptidase